MVVLRLVSNVLLGQAEWPACRGGCLVRTVRMARVQRWVSCQVKQKGLFPGMRLVFQKQAYRCRPMETAKQSWRGLGMRDADKSRTGKASQKVVDRLKDTNLLSRVTIVLKCFSTTSEREYFDWLSVDKMYRFERIF